MLKIYFYVYANMPTHMLTVAGKEITYFRFRSYTCPH